MTNLKNEYPKTVAPRTQSFKRWSIFLGLFVLVATTTGAALAYNSGAKGQTFKATFTKWVITMPPPPFNMVGVVDGDVGPGTYTGEVISMDPGDEITSIQALYHINGSIHAFTADLKITQNNSTGKATITGRVTEGWQEGASVIGKYITLADCPIKTPGNVFAEQGDEHGLCFQGALLVQAP